MARKKAYAKMTDKQLVRAVFPKDVRHDLKRVIADLNAEKKPGKRKKR